MMMSSNCSPRFQTSPTTNALPKHLILPKSSLNQCTTFLLRLPELSNGECYFTAAVTSTSDRHQAEFCVHPSQGLFGGPNGTSSIALHFTPFEYCTLTYEVVVTFHPAEKKQVYVVKVVGSCSPNSEWRANQREAACLEDLTAEISRKPTIKTRTKRQTKTTVPSRLPQASLERGSNLLTPAGILKFLSRKKSNTNSFPEPSNFFDKEQLAKFEQIQSQFLRELNVQDAREKALASDYGKSRIGQDAVTDETFRRIEEEFEEHLASYEKLQGRDLDQLLNLTKPRYAYQRIPQDVGASGDNETTLKSDYELVLSPKSAILKPFVQAAYKIMLRYRVDKRIPAIRALVQSTKVMV